MDNAKKMLIMRHGFKSITFSAYKERLLKLFRMAADRPNWWTAGGTTSRYSTLKTT